MRVLTGACQLLPMSQKRTFHGVKGGLVGALWAVHLVGKCDFGSPKHDLSSSR